MSETTEQTIEAIHTLQATPVEPARLIEMWRAAAKESPQQGAAALNYCATHLETWMRHEGDNIAMCMPRAYIRLIRAALHFDPRQQTSCRELAEAAVNLRGGASQ